MKTSCNDQRDKKRERARYLCNSDITHILAMRDYEIEH